MNSLLRTLALALSLLFAWLVPAMAQDTGVTSAPTATPVAAPEASGPARPALWKVGDEDTTIYLFGTIHALPAGLTWFNGPIEAALHSSGQLVTEIPDTDPAEMQSAVVSNAMLPSGETLRGLLKPEDKAKFEKAVSELGLPVEAFDPLEPWFAALSLALTPVKAGGFDPASGADVRIAAEAKQLGIPRMGLETAGYQMAMFSKLPMETQTRYLNEVIDGMPKIPQEMADMIREWSAGNPDKVAELDNSEEDDPVMIKALLTDRNRTWAEWARLRLKRPGTVFVAVGAGHLAGKDSVLDMLGKAGVRVERVQ
jgi:uncharacterized protein YbaP (TraB family)